MAPPDSILQLFQLHPFPLPFTRKHFVMPQPSNQIFAISSGMDQLSTKLSMVNLMDCHKVNSMYLWEEHGVLKKSLNSTCLGPLYLQDFAAAKSLSDMEIIAQKETVLQLQDNWYLVHCPTAYTGHITCSNLYNSVVFLKPGANCFYISPSCRLQLSDHMIISDISLKLDNTIKLYEWEMDKIAFAEDKEFCSTTWLTVLNDRKSAWTTLLVICQAIAAQRHSSVWHCNFTLLTILIILVISVAVAYFLLT